MVDCAIIGTGAAGISAALTLRALGRSFLLFGRGELSEKIRRAEKIRNYPGLADVRGEELQAAFLKQLAAAEISVTEKTVTGVYAADGRFFLLSGNEEYEARTVILATGVEAVKPIEGEAEFLGRGVSCCAACDGFLYRNKTIAVVCTSKEHEGEISYLASLARKVYLCAVYKNAAVSGDNIEQVGGMPLKIAGGDRAETLVFADREIRADGVFVLRAAVAPAVLVSGLQAEGGHVSVDRACRTNLAGCFAAGDCTGRPYQYAKAAGEGNVAAHSVNEYLYSLS